MGLAVYLKTNETVQHLSTNIFVREDGANIELSMKEAIKRFPGNSIHQYIKEDNIAFSANVTHNLNKMADAVGLYEYLWRPDEHGITKARQLIDPLREGLHKLKLYPEEYKKYNPKNGWGSYDIFIKFVQDYLDACYKYPDADIVVDR